MSISICLTKFHPAISCLFIESSVEMLSDVILTTFVFSPFFSTLNCMTLPPWPRFQHVQYWWNLFTQSIQKHLSEDCVSNLLLHWTLIQCHLFSTVRDSLCTSSWSMAKTMNSQCPWHLLSLDLNGTFFLILLWILPCLCRLDWSELWLR